MDLVAQQQSQQSEIVFESNSSVDSSIWQKEITITTTGLWGWGILLIIIIGFVGAIGYMWGKKNKNNDLMIEVPERELEIVIGNLTVNTKDDQKVELEATLYVFIEEENRRKAAWNFLQNTDKQQLEQDQSTRITQITEEDIRVKIEKRVIREIRTAVNETSLKNLTSHQLRHKIEPSLKTQLKNLGLTLHQIIIEIVSTVQSVKFPKSEIFIDINLMGERAIYTKDYQKLEVQVGMYVYIDKKNEQKAKDCLPKSEDYTITPEIIAEVVEKRVIFAVRSAAQKKDFRHFQSDSEKDNDADAESPVKSNAEKYVETLLTKSLENIGLTINDLYLDILTSGEVPQSEFAIDVILTDELSVRTKDFLRANIRATVYVYIQKEDREKAKKLLSKGRSITLQDIEMAVAERANSAIRITAGKHSLEYIHSHRNDFAEEVITGIDSEDGNKGEKQEKEVSLKSSLKKLGLSLNGIYLTEVEESDIYSSDDIFDIQGITKRTAIIQNHLNKQRIQELNIQYKNEKKDVAAQKSSLRNAAALEQAKIQQELALEKFRHKQELDQELAIVKQREEKEKEIAETEKTIELEKLQIKAELEADKVKHETTILDQHKAIEEHKARIETDIYKAKEIEAEEAKEMAQLASSINITEVERRRLAAELERVKDEELIPTAIEKAKAERQELIASILANAAEDEAQKIIKLAQAEVRGKEGLKDADRMADLIMTLAPKLMESLPEIAKAASLEPGALADANIYTLSGKNGSPQDLKNLMLSSNGLFILNALSEKLIDWIEKGAEFMTTKETEKNQAHLNGNGSKKTVETQSKSSEEESSLQNKKVEKLETNNINEGEIQEENNNENTNNSESKEEINANNLTGDKAKDSEIVSPEESPKSNKPWWKIWG